jgi:hypothetical protein
MDRKRHRCGRRRSEAKRTVIIQINGKEYRLAFSHYRTKEAAKLVNERQPFTCANLYERDEDGVNWNTLIHVDTKLHKGDVYDDERGRKYAIAQILDEFTEVGDKTTRREFWRQYFGRRKSQVMCKCCKGTGAVKTYPRVEREF